ncbi:MAG TPA: hypothetical protein VE737_11365 [Actinomycetota bacterium]|nr:hypothetical protein [Actinomycetota bacterium]
MPRRHRAARDRSSPPRPGPTGATIPGWAQREGVTVRQVTGDRPYRCPGCQQPIRPGTLHLVVVPDEDVDLRRHWHERCWRTELRRRR